MRLPRSFAAWLAIFSLVLHGLMPLVAHAAVKVTPGAMLICSTSADQQNVGQNGTATVGAAHQHCVCCTNSGGLPALPVAAATIALQVAAASAAPQPAPTMPLAYRPAGSAHPRAPPRPI